MDALPRGVSADSLSGSNRAVLRNPLIAEAFHRTGSVEICGCGTNTLIEGAADTASRHRRSRNRPGSAFVTFEAPIELVPTRGTKSALSRDQVQVQEASRDVQTSPNPRSRAVDPIAPKLGDQVLRPLIRAGVLEFWS